MSSSNLSKDICELTISFLKKNIADSTREGVSIPEFEIKKGHENKIEDYVLHCISTLQLENTTIKYSLYLINKLLVLNQEIRLTHNNIFKIFFIAVYISSKLNEDITYSHERFARVGCFGRKVLSVMEEKYLELMDYKIMTLNDITEGYFLFEREL